MMPIPQLDSVTARLVSIVGAGCQLMGDQGEVSITFEHRHETTGLLLNTSMHNGDEISFWLDEKEWCEWVSSVLVIPSFSMIPEEFKAVLAKWTLDTLKICVDIEGFEWPTVKQMSPHILTQGMGWRLCARCHDRVLNLQVTQAPGSWLEMLVSHASPNSEEKKDPPIIIGAKLVAGWTLLARDQISAIQAGSALVLQQQTDISNGNFFLFTHRPLAIVHQNRGTGVFTVETLMETFDDWIDIGLPTGDLMGEENPVIDAPIPVVVEVANFNVSVNELSQIKPGYLLPSESHHSTSVSLRIGHHIFAFGTLLRIGERLAVRIDRVC